MRKLRIAIIGQGRSGRDIHGLYLQTESAKERFEVAAVVEEDESRRKRAEEEYGVPVYSSYQELFPYASKIDLVVNSSYSVQHGPITMDLLSHGFNVLCEKPAAVSVEEFDQMCACAKANGRELFIFQQSRFAAYFKKVREVLDSGVLGRIIDVDIRFNGFSRRWDWQTLLSMNGGSLRNTGPHPLDQALVILNDYEHMPDVFCRMDRVGTFGDAEDYVKLILTGKDKPLIDLTISCCDAYPCYTYKIHGQYGGLKGTMAHIDWRYYDPEKAPAQTLSKKFISKPDGTPAYCSEKLPWKEESWDGDPNAPFDQAVADYYSDIYEHIVKGSPLEVTLTQVRQQVMVYEEAHRQNQWMEETGRIL
ncbi:MAG: Gfo/Idh/MocA family oxidoreductase [Firmicutes bacterium]|nr:Gfo/Idh/MocA family oxidoreductase [Bacillota bacterium]